jgi:HEPN domain-containing protein
MSQSAATYDRNALLVGQAVMAETGAEDVILFGSRARGDFREDSDIDLLVIHPDPWDLEIEREAKKNAQSNAEALYGLPITIDLVWITYEDFSQMRLSINDVAAIATEEGFLMNGDPAVEQYPNDDEDYSYEWTVTEQRCYHASSHLRMLRLAVENRQPSIMVGQQAHQALEHAIKGLISARGRRYRLHHDLVSLELEMRQTDAGFDHDLESPLRILNGYSGSERYNRPFPSLGDRHELLRQVESDIQQIFQRIAELSCRDPRQEQA